MYVFKTKTIFLKTTIIKIVFGLLPLSLLAQQPVLRSSSVQSGGGSLQNSSSPKVERAAVNSGEIKDQLKSVKPIESENAEVVIVGKYAPVGVNVNFLPLFGGFEKNEIESVEQENFFADCDQNFKSRSEASKFFSKAAWDYLAEGGKDLATHRFNLAWSLDANNVEAYWGLGVVQYQKGNFHDAIQLMKQGLVLAKEEKATLLVDLATVYIKCFTDHKDPSEMEMAFDLLDQAVEINPEFTNAYMQMTLAALVNGNIDQAWLNFHRGYEVNPDAVSVELLAELLEHKADPKGVFVKP